MLVSQPILVQKNIPNEMFRKIDNEALFHFPGDEELLEKISSVERYSRQEREEFGL